MYEAAYLKTSLLTRGPTDGDVFARITGALAQQGYSIVSGIFSEQQLQGWLIDIKRTDPRQFHTAGVGRDLEHQLNPFVRRDRICWREPGYEPLADYFAWIEHLRLCLNRQLFLGLFDFECQYAHYPRGAFYKRHYDSFHGESNRRLSTILYLNPVWHPQDGGELVIYAAEGDTALQTVLPTFGTMVFFLSEEFPHEVLVSRRSRYSITGWFRINYPARLPVDNSGV